MQKSCQVISQFQDTYETFQASPNRNFTFIMQYLAKIRSYRYANISVKSNCHSHLRNSSTILHYYFLSIEHLTCVDLCCTIPIIIRHTLLRKKKRKKNVGVQKGNLYRGKLREERKKYK